MLVTGVKRDIALLERVEAQAGDTVTVLDISLARNITALQKLLGHAEMGELFKVIAFSRGLEGATAPGLRGQDRSGEL